MIPNSVSWCYLNWPTAMEFSELAGRGWTRNGWGAIPRCIRLLKRYESRDCRLGFSMATYVGVSMSSWGVPQVRWLLYFRENPTKIWMMSGGSPIETPCKNLQIPLVATPGLLDSGSSPWLIVFVGWHAWSARLIDMAQSGDTLPETNPFHWPAFLIWEFLLIFLTI